MDCSRSAMLTICARLGRFMLTRYFSIMSPSCFCALALTPPTWLTTLENSGDSITLLAKALNPFSISPIMFCQIATGSLLFSAIGALQHDHGAVPPRCFHHTTLLRQDGQHCGYRSRDKTFCSAKNRAIESSSQYYIRGTAKVNATAHRPPQIAR